MEEIKRTLSKITEQQAELAQEISGLKKKPKDLWDKFSVASSFLSGFIAVVIGGLFTFYYHQKDEIIRKEQNRISEMEVTRKFIEPLTGKDEKAKEFAILSMRKFANPELAMYWVKAAPSEGTKRAGGIIMATSQPDSPKTKPQPQVTATSSASEQGWVYIGEFTDGNWKKPYFNVNTVKPENLIHSQLKATGTVNIRSGMVTDDGVFQPVISSLSAGKTIKVDEVKDWQDTGYIWAKISAVK